MNLKQGDTAPAYRADLNADITGASAISIRFSKLNGTFVMVRTGTITDGPTGIVTYQWVAANDGALINNVGNYPNEVVVTFADGRIQHFPQRGHLEVRVQKAVPAA